MTMQAAPTTLLVSAQNASITTQKFHDDSDVLNVALTRTDRRRLLKAEAERLVIAYPELLDLMAAAALKRARAMAHAQPAAIDTDANRYNVVREAYWDSSNPASPEFYSLRNVLAECCDIEAPSPAQLRTLFFLLPSDVIRSGIRWGFDDSDVRGAIWHYVESHTQDVRAAMQPPQ